MQDWQLCARLFKPRLAPAGLMAAHVADCSPGMCKVLKSEWVVGAMSPGVADNITLGIAAGAGLVAVRVALEASAGACSIGGCTRERV